MIDTQVAVTAILDRMRLKNINQNGLSTARIRCAFCARWRSHDVDQCVGCGATEVEGASDGG